MPKIIKVGCCGYPLKKEEYYRKFKCVEIQSTFYQLPAKVETVQKWKKEAPKDFEFTIKAWQLITHPSTSPTYRRLKEKISKPEDCGNFQATKEVFTAWERTKEVAKVLEAKIIVFQCPASFKPTRENIENLRNFFREAGNEDLIFAWEPRGEWPEDLVKNLCKELNLIHCVDPFKQKSGFGEINYFRLHGRPGYNLGYKYTDSDLKELLKFCQKKENYVFFNNLSMLPDSLKFKKLISLNSTTE